MALIIHVRIGMFLVGKTYCTSYQTVLHIRDPLHTCDVVGYAVVMLSYFAD